MLDNEPNQTTDQTTQALPATGEPSPTSESGTRPARKRTASKRTASKRAASMSAEPTAADDTVRDESPPDGTGTDGTPSEGSAPAKKAAKRATKKTAAKRTAKKAAASDETPAPASGTGPEGEVTPARKTTRKRTGRRSAATDSPAADPDAASDAPPPVRFADTSAPRATADAGSGDSGIDSGSGAASRTESGSESRSGSGTDSGSSTDSGSGSGTESRSAAARRRAAAAAAAVLFQPPVEPPTTAEPAALTSEPRRRRTRKQAAGSGSGEPGAELTVPIEASLPDADLADPADQDLDADLVDDDTEGDGTRRRRRRRGGRRRRKAGEAEVVDGDLAGDHTDDDVVAEVGDDAVAGPAEPGAHPDGDAAEDEDEAGGSTRRRRRRRRRKGEDSATSADDPEEIVVRVREPRSKAKAKSSSEITAVEGSTRLEAKKQRRREGRAAGRRRAPIVSEAEFLARRESVERTMVIRTREDLTQIAVSEDNVLVEHYVAQAEQSSLIGNVYLGRVQNVLPSMEAAFIDIGRGRNAVLYAGEVDWATLGAGNGQRRIESVLKSGQPVLVQVTKDPIGHKGSRLTNQISLPGRYVVYVPRGGNGGISRKLPDIERSRLKGILKDIIPDEAGVIVRTAAEGASTEELTRDVSRLKSYWDDIEKKAKSGQAPQLLYGEPDLLIRVVRDLFTEDFTRLVISGDEAFDLVHEYVSYVAPHLADRVERWTQPDDVFAHFRLDEQIRKALDRKVWLPSGGSLVIDRTEAMTVVDVNTGKFTGSGGNLEETVTRNNLEAAEEMVRQLRLRDIGGIIVVDFIDMVLESNRDLVLRRLVECLGRDRTKHQVAEVTSLGLVQMTRKRIGTGLLEAFSETCDHCGGRGLLLHDEPKEPRRRQSEEPAKPAKTARSGRGKGRGKGKQEPAEEPPNDAAQRLAEIAAVTVGRDGSPADPGSDTEPHQGSDTASDRGPDTASDQGSDTGSDRGPDTRSETGSGTGPDSGPDRGTGAPEAKELAVAPV